MRNVIAQMWPACITSLSRIFLLWSPIQHGIAIAQIPDTPKFLWSKPQLLPSNAAQITGQLLISRVIAASPKQLLISSISLPRLAEPVNHSQAAFATIKWTVIARSPTQQIDFMTPLAWTNRIQTAAVYHSHLASFRSVNVACPQIRCLPPQCALSIRTILVVYAKLSQVIIVATAQLVILAEM